MWDRVCLFRRRYNLSLAANLAALSVEASPRDVRDTALVKMSGEISCKSQQHTTPNTSYLVWMVLRLRNADNDGFMTCAPPQPTVPKTNPPAAPINAAANFDDDIAK